MKVFWNKIKKPFFCLAPMADVTDVAFREMFAKYGKPDVTWTEFVSADGLASEGVRVLKYDLMFTEKERPIVVQLFGSNPEKMRIAAKMCALLGFDGIDINMGCPDKSIEKQGAGAALIKNKTRAKEIVESARQGILDSGKKVGLSVKTRIGYNKNEIEEWVPFLLSLDLDVLTIHARTRKQMSLVDADWSHVKRVVEIRNQMGLKTKIIGNGDVKNIEDGLRLVKETGCDGVMVGRGVFGSPWFFSGKIPKLEKKLKILVEHTKLFEKKLGKIKSFSVMKKHYKAYVNGFDGAKELRMILMEAKDSNEVKSIIKDFLIKIKK